MQKKKTPHGHKFTGKYKSLNDFEWNNIPKLAIITGLNGAGKSQLLELIQQYIKDAFGPVGGLGGKAPVNMVISNAKFQASEMTYLKSEWSLKESTEIDLGKIQNSTSSLYNRMVSGGPDLLTLRHSDLKLYVKLHEVKEHFLKLGKTGLQISLEEFREELDKSEIDDDTTVVQSVSEFFYNYRLQYLELKVAGKNDEEIIAQIGAKPWEVLRDIIEEAQLPFEITDPSNMNIRGTYKLVITKKTNREVVKFDDLSSGERVLFSLAFLLFNSQEAKRFPKLLLLDEPDAHLHPLMTAQLLNVLKNVLVEKYRVQIVMTTHSPSTVAISSEESVFLMDADIGFPQPVNKGFAIKSLLAGIPNVYVSYEDRRQVFVESENDVVFYDKLYKRIFQKLNQDVNLNFISSGDSATDKNKQPIANCDQVIKITGILRESGNKHIYGIIDFDEGKNTGSDYLLVLGEGNRYSIENYIFDPLIVGMLLLREKMIVGTDLGAPDLVYTDVNTHTVENLQQLSNYVVENVNREAKETSVDKRDCDLLNGMVIKIPMWYLLYHGHTLEELLVKVFPKLGEIKKNKEALLKLAMIDRVIDDFPGLLSVDILKVFERIQF